MAHSLHILKRLFHDKRLTVVVLVSWLVLVCCIFYTLGAFHGQFMTFGPSDATEFMSMRIDTWPKWYALAVFSFCNTTINEFIGSALVPWLTNTIQDQKTRYLDHSKGTCMAISLTFDVYTHIMSIFGLYLMFSQFDFLMIRMVADCIVTTFTTAEWMRNKTVDKVKHDLEGGFIADDQWPGDTPTVASGGFAHEDAGVAMKGARVAICISNTPVTVHPPADDLDQPVSDDKTSLLEGVSPRGPPRAPGRKQ